MNTYKLKLTPQDGGNLKLTWQYKNTPLQPERAVIIDQGQWDAIEAFVRDPSGQPQYILYPSSTVEVAILEHCGDSAYRNFAHVDSLATAQRLVKKLNKEDS